MRRIPWALVASAVAALLLAAPASASVWRSKPIFIGHRTKKEIEEARKVDVKSLARSAARLGARQGRATTSGWC